MEEVYSRTVAPIKVKRTVFSVSITVYTTYTVIRIPTKKLSVYQLQSILDQIFFFEDIDYRIRFTDLSTVIYCNSSSVCDKYIAN